MNKKLKLLVLSAVLCVGIPTIHAVTIEDLTAPPLIADVKISPTGEYLAIKVFRDGKYSLMFSDRESFSVLGALIYSGTEEAGDYFWANNERVVAEVYASED